MVALPEDRYQAAYQVFLDRLRTARTACGLTQVQAAKLLGRDQYWLSRCETGARRVDLVELIVLAKIYHKPLNYFAKDLIETR